MDRLYKYKSRFTANWDRVPKVEGRVIDRGSLTIDKKDRPFLKVESSDGEVTVFQSAGLEDLFKAAAVGDFVSIEFLALVQTAKGRAFRQFRSSCWTDPDALPVSGKRGRKPKVTREKTAGK